MPQERRAGASASANTTALEPQKQTGRRPTRRELEAARQFLSPRRGGWRRIDDVIADLIADLEVNGAE